MSKQLNPVSRFSWWFGIGLVLAVVLAVASRPVSHSLTYIRYVSPPRLDGTRCTFLYPSILGPPALSGAIYSRGATGRRYQIQSVQVFSRVSTGDAFIQRLSILRRAIAINSAELSITSVDDPAQKDPFPTRPIESKNPRYIKSESTSIGEGGGEHDLVIKDKRSGTRYNLEYVCWLPDAGGNSAGDFARADAIISQSFQVLPRGAALPTGPPK